MAAEIELHQVRLFGIAHLFSNLFSAFLIRTFGGSRPLRSMWGVQSMDPEVLGMSVLLAVLSVAGTLFVVVIFGSCFRTFYAGLDHDPIMGEDCFPSWSDAVLSLLLLATCGLVVYASFFG